MNVHMRCDEKAMLKLLHELQKVKPDAGLERRPGYVGLRSLKIVVKDPDRPGMDLTVTLYGAFERKGALSGATTGGSGRRPLGPIRWRRR